MPTGHIARLPSLILPFQYGPNPPSYTFPHGSISYFLFIVWENIRLVSLVFISVSVLSCISHNWRYHMYDFISQCYMCNVWYSGSLMTMWMVPGIRMVHRFPSITTANNSHFLLLGLFSKQKNSQMTKNYVCWLKIMVCCTCWYRFLITLHQKYKEFRDSHLS